MFLFHIETNFLLNCSILILLAKFANFVRIWLISHFLNSILGKDEPKAPTMHIKPKDPKSFVTPAPGAYNPELAEKDVKLAAPKYSFGIKSKDSKSIPGPGRRIC